MCLFNNYDLLLTKLKYVYYLIQYHVLRECSLFKAGKKKKKKNLKMCMTSSILLIKNRHAYNKHLQNKKEISI